MWTLSVPWWELVLRAVMVYTVLLLLIRISGRRTVGQFTPFDLLVVMLLSESVSNALTGGDDSLLAGIISATVLITLNRSIAFTIARSERAQVFIEGEPILIGKDGRLFERVLVKQRVPVADVKQALREADCSLASLHLAFLEADGQISILKKTSVES